MEAQRTLKIVNESIHGRPNLKVGNEELPIVRSKSHGMTHDRNYNGYESNYMLPDDCVPISLSCPCTSVLSIN